MGMGKGSPREWVGILTRLINCLCMGMVKDCSRGWVSVSLCWSITHGVGEGSPKGWGWVSVTRLISHPVGMGKDFSGVGKIFH